MAKRPVQQQSGKRCTATYFVKSEYYGCKMCGIVIALVSGQFFKVVGWVTSKPKHQKEELR
jgi:hypothetical protein